MAQVLLYVPDSVPRGFLKLVEPELVQLVPPADDYPLFDRSHTCACSTRHGIALRGSCITVQRGQHEIVAYPVYALPEDCTCDETVVILAWLLRHRFKAFHTYLADGSLQRTLKANTWFRRAPCDTCCESYTLCRDPVFMLKSIVVSPFGKGPTLESTTLS